MKLKLTFTNFSKGKKLGHTSDLALFVTNHVKPELESEIGEFVNEVSFNVTKLTNKKFKVLVITSLRNKNIVVEKQGESFYQVVFFASKVFIKKVLKYRKKSIDKKRHRKVQDKQMLCEQSLRDLEESVCDGFDIQRVKTHVLKPMFIDEAILQMEMLGHKFFLFTDADNKEHCLVYKRKNGSYGIIKPCDEY